MPAAASFPKASSSGVKPQVETSKSTSHHAECFLLSLGWTEVQRNLPFGQVKYFCEMWNTPEACEIFANANVGKFHFTLRRRSNISQFMEWIISHSAHAEYFTKKYRNKCGWYTRLRRDWDARWRKALDYLCSMWYNICKSLYYHE